MCGGDIPQCAAGLLTNVQLVAATREAFVALRADGSVVTWGASLGGGDSSAVFAQLQSGVLHVVASRLAFFAFKSPNKALVVWGQDDAGGDASAVVPQLSSGVVSVAHTFLAAAAIKEDGTVAPSAAVGTLPQCRRCCMTSLRCTQPARRSPP
jgi:hypothetical protein